MAINSDVPAVALVRPGEDVPERPSQARPVDRRAAAFVKKTLVETAVIVKDRIRWHREELARDRAQLTQIMAMIEAGEDSHPADPVE